jgi:dTDP-4-dehydrorhamnose reductase
VDEAEAEPELAMAINGVGPGILAEEAKRINAALIHYSTDYVFDGSKGEPYTEEDQPNPLNVYGNTKLAGERAIQDVGGDYLIFRTSWVYSLRRPCFVTKVLKWAREQETLRIVDDQVSSPTWSRTLAEATSQVLFRCVSGYSKFTLGKQGIYHLSDRGSCSRYEWVKEILNCYPNKSEITVKNIIPAKSHEFPTTAVRPSFSALSCNKIVDEFKFELPHWKEALSLLFP